MKCPYCNGKDLKVIDSRGSEDVKSIRRRRECESCGKRFTTYERIEEVPLMIIKKNNLREEFDRSKIISGISKACWKRQVSRSDIEATVDKIENELFGMGLQEIDSEIIGKVVMKHLKDLDGIAYVRFASIYKEFKDVDTFLEELKKLL